jgi:glucosamine--fructose-6-phosphate aminotransferase (isomerizing)
MKLLGNLPDPFLAEIAGQPEAIRRAADAVAAQAPSLARLRDESASRTPVFTGMGSSYFACYAPVTALAEAGILAPQIDSAEVLHFRRAALGPGSLLVVVSQSGESAEAVRLLRLVREAGSPDGAGRPFVVSVTNGLGSSVAGAADVALDTKAGEEHGPSTMTFAGALVVLAALGRVLSGADVDRAVGWVGEQAARAATAAEALLGDAAARAAEYRSWLGARGTLATLGRGAARAAAEMGALALKEAARFPAESLEAAQFRHGPLELAGPELAAAVIATEPATRALDEGLAGELVEAGAAVLLCTPEGGAPGGALSVAVGDVDPSLAPAVAVIPLQLLAWSLALERGREPGAFTIASKVTTRE